MRHHRAVLVLVVLAVAFGLQQSAPEAQTTPKPAPTPRGYDDLLAGARSVVTALVAEDYDGLRLGFPDWTEESVAARDAVTSRDVETGKLPWNEYRKGLAAKDPGNVLKVEAIKDWLALDAMKKFLLSTGYFVVRARADFNERVTKANWLLLNRALEMTTVGFGQGEAVFLNMFGDRIKLRFEQESGRWYLRSLEIEFREN
jgi:hypothetical protein